MTLSLSLSLSLSLFDSSPSQLNNSSFLQFFHSIAFTLKTSRATIATKFYKKKKKKKKKRSLSFGTRTTKEETENSTPIGVILFFSNGTSDKSIQKSYPFLFDLVWNNGVLWFLFRFSNPLMLLIALIWVLLVLKVNLNYMILKYS